MSAKLLLAGQPNNQDHSPMKNETKRKLKIDSENMMSECLVSNNENQIFKESNKRQRTIPMLANNITARSEERTMASSSYPQIGKPAPVFKGTAVVNGQFKEISLTDFKGKWVVLFFYPMDFTFVCPTEIIAFSDRVAEFQKLNVEVIAASTDSHYTHLAWINTPRKEGGLGSLNIPLLADKTGKISQDYGVYLEDKGIPLRGLFLIDEKGVLRQITINDLPVGRSVDETIRLVQAFQYTDVHGEVCPANWKPGDETIKPGVDSSKEYFSKKN